MDRPVGEEGETRLNPRTMRFVGMAVAFALLVAALPLSAQQDARAVRSAFVYNLTKYVAWPQSKRTLLIGFIGDQSTGLTMRQTLEGKSSDGRKLQVLLNPAASELSACDIVYVTSAETPKLDTILPRLRGTPILTVGEDGRFPAQGGMVGLTRSGDQIQIEVNLEALHHAGLKMSSRLLELATLVSSKEQMK